MAGRVVETKVDAVGAIDYRTLARKPLATSVATATGTPCANDTISG